MGWLKKVRAVLTWLTDKLLIGRNRGWWDKRGGVEIPDDTKPPGLP